MDMPADEQTGSNPPQMLAQYLATGRATMTCFIAVVFRRGMYDNNVSIQGNLAPQLLSVLPCIAKRPAAIGWRIRGSKNLERGLWSIGLSQANVDRFMTQEFDGRIFLT